MKRFIEVRDYGCGAQANIYYDSQFNGYSAVVKMPDKKDEYFCDDIADLYDAIDKMVENYIQRRNWG